MRTSAARIAAASLWAAVAVAGGALWYRYDLTLQAALARSPPTAPAGQPQLQVLSDLGPLRDAFNAHADRARVVVLASPT